MLTGIVTWASCIENIEYRSAITVCNNVTLANDLQSNLLLYFIKFAIIIIIVFDSLPTHQNAVLA